MTNKPLDIGIEGGHGKDPDDTGCTGLWINECDYTIYMARAFTSLIKRLDTNIVPHLIRVRNDEYISFEQRALKALQTSCDIVYVLHVDSTEDISWHGAKVFHWPEDSVGQQVGDTILRAMPKPLYRNRRSMPTLDTNSNDGYYGRPRATLESYQYVGINAILIELGFASNEYDRTALLDRDVQFSILVAFLAGIGRLRQLQPWGVV